MTYGRWNLDLVYGAFLFYGGVALFSSILPFIPFDTEAGLFIGTVLLTPLHVLSLVALVIGIAFALRLLREWKVAALLAALIADWALFAGVLTYGVDIDLMIAASSIYGLITCAISVAWFLLDRNPKPGDAHST
jgi:hypothetical protein